MQECLVLPLYYTYDLQQQNYVIHENALLYPFEAFFCKQPAARLNLL
jgi:hypothetical protein